MLSGRIENANVELGAPRDWDPAIHGDCGVLHARVDETSAGLGLTSAWFPLPDEIARIAAGAPVYLTVLGDSHPPVCMAVGPIPLDK